MANRSYLYSLSNRPASYEDRPETISGLAEWSYCIAFTARVLMSGEPRLCASLISDGFDGDPSDKKSKMFAISGDFELGFARLQKFISILRPIAVGASPNLANQIEETIAFLESHRDHYLLLETIELDMMTAENAGALKASVEREIANCLLVGAAIDALPLDVQAAGKWLKASAKQKGSTPFDAFYGLRLDNDFDNIRDRKTEYPLGLEWSEVLYFELWNRTQFETNRTPAS